MSKVLFTFIFLAVTFLATPPSMAQSKETKSGDSVNRDDPKAQEPAGQNTDVESTANAKGVLNAKQCCEGQITGKEKTTTAFDGAPLEPGGKAFVPPKKPTSKSNRKSD